MYSKSLTFADKSSDKFWEIVAKGDSFTVTFGRTGSAGQKQTKSFPDAKACLRAAEKMVEEKLRKGYVERAPAAASPKDPEPPVTAKAAAPNRPRNFLSSKGKDPKSWTIEVRGKTITTTTAKRFGDPKTTKQTLPTAEKCEKEFAKLIAAKVKEGYEEVALHFPGVDAFTLKRVQDAAADKATTLTVNANQSAELLRHVFSLTHLENLTIEHAGVVPDELAQLQELTRLQIDHSPKLEALPKTIGKLSKLYYLTIEDTGLKCLPDEIGELQSLEELRVSQNASLSSLPPAMGKLSRLKKVYVQGHGSEKQPLDIPKEIGDLAALTRLQLPSNHLKTLPAEIGNLEQLTELDLNFNKLKALPVEIGSLANLEELSLLYNPIAELPRKLCQLESLESLELEGCEIRNVPKEILNEGKEAILQFLGGGTKETKRLAPVNADPQVLAACKPRIDDFCRKAKSRIFKDTTRKTLDNLVALITGKSDEVPPARSQDVYFFADFAKVFAPFRSWTFVEERLLAYLAQEAWSTKKGKDGYHESFFRWLKEQVTNNDSDGLAEAVIAKLAAAGIPKDALLPQSLKKMGACIVRSEGEPSSYGRLLLTANKAELQVILAAAKDDETTKKNVVSLFLRHREDALADHLPELIGIEKSKSGSHVPHETIESLCKIRPEQCESLIIDYLPQVDCLSCRAELGRILLEHFGPKHRERVLEIAKETLTQISERKNKDKGDYDFSWSEGESYSDGTPQYIEWVLRQFGDQARQLVFTYVEATKVLDLDITNVALRYLGQAAVDIAGEALHVTIGSNDQAAHYRKLFSALAGLDYSRHLDRVWEIATSEFKDVRETAALALAKLDTAVVVPRAQALLTAKAAHEREAGVFILSLIGSAECVKLLRPLLDTERNDEVRDLAVACVYGSDAGATRKQVAARIASAAARGKLDKPIAKWLDEKALPKLRWTDGSALDAQDLRFLFYRQSRQKEIAPETEAAAAYALVDKKTSGDFAFKLLQLVLKNGGAKAPNRFALAITGLLGDGRIVEPLRDLAIEAMNENACTTLGLQTSLESARALDRIMQVFRVKYPNVRSAAKEAFDRIAAGLDLSPYALSDKMTPDFGFVDGRKELKKGKGKGNAFAVRMGKDLKVELCDGDGACLKALPKTADESTKAELKELGAQVRDIVRQQKVNLENYLVVQRRWQRDDWEGYFLANPIAHALAQGLLWGAYNGDALDATFAVGADGKLTAADGSAVRLGKQRVGLVHPLELPADASAAWRSRFERDTIEPPFAQLDRPVHKVDGDERDQTFSFRFEDKSLFGATFKSRAERLGWRRGSVVDAGEVSAYRKAFTTDQVEAFVRLSGLGAQSYEEEVTLGELFFVKQGAIVCGSYTYDEPRDQKDERLIKLADLPAIVYSETIADLHKITKSKDEEEE